MARKQSSTSSPTASSSTLSLRKAPLALQTAVSLIALSLTLFVTQTVLAPVFGGVATNLHLHSVVAALIVASTILPFRGSDARTCQVMLSSFLCAAPAILHWLATLATQLDNPILGPILAYTPVLAPIAFFATDGVRGVLAGRSQTVKSLNAILVSAFVLKTQQAWTILPYSRILSQPLLLLIFGWAVVASGQVLKESTPDSRGTRKRNYIPLLLPLIMSILSLSRPPSLIRSLPYAHPNGLLRILSSSPSVTGRIVVAEDYTHSFRFLRADHSLLGGVWIGDNYLAKMDEDAEFVLDKFGTKLGESIYSTFVLQEAARLQERETPQQNVLIIGLGVGIAAQAFMQHGLSTSIVEIDPAVYSAARDYFGVSEPAAAYIEDARGWVHRQASLKNGTYDIVVHDCFSGGGVPAHLFTSEFWQELRTIMSPDGILAVNYAGLVNSESSRAVLATLKQQFGHCRVFHDYRIDIPEENLTSEFINLVFFCSPSSKPLTFRPATRGDYLSSYLREHVLRVLPEREVRHELILGDISPDEEATWVLTDARNPLGAWQDKGALDHWKVMRSVLPDYVWSTY